MSAELHIETLDFTDPNDLSSNAIDAANMLVEEAYATDVPGFGYTGLSDYLHRIDPVTDTHYAIIDESGVVAVAEVMHGQQRNTEIAGIVVRADKRGQGCARVLLKHIAKEAQEKGDIFLKVAPVKPEFAEKLGFAAVALEEGDDYMYALPEDIIDPSSPPVFFDY